MATEERLFGYYINLDERGEFYADVRDQNEKTVFEIHGFEIFEDGFMRDKNDLKGLKEHLVDLGIMSKDDELLEMREFEARLEAAKQDEKESSFKPMTTLEGVVDCLEVGVRSEIWDSADESAEQVEEFQIAAMWLCNKAMAMADILRRLTTSSDPKAIAQAKALLDEFDSSAYHGVRIEYLHAPDANRYEERKEGYAKFAGFPNDFDRFKKEIEGCLKDRDKFPLSFITGKEEDEEKWLKVVSIAPSLTANKNLPIEAFMNAVREASEHDWALAKDDDVRPGQ